MKMTRKLYFFVLAIVWCLGLSYFAQRRGPGVRRGSQGSAAQDCRERPCSTVAELLPRLHPLAPYPPSLSPYLVVLATTWFLGDMPYFRGLATCPVSGCRVTLSNRGNASDADVVLYHTRPEDLPNGGAGLIKAPTRPTQLVALMSAEGSNVAHFDPAVFSSFNAENSFRATSLVHDSYVLWFLNDAHKQGISTPQRPLRLDARVWADIWEPPLPMAARSRSAMASWGSSYCGTLSNREDLVRALLSSGVKIAIYGADNCLRNMNTTPEKRDEFRAMRTHKFYLAFENHRTDGYVTEKFYWALLRGQVPIVWGAPDISRFAPSNDSFIDASQFAGAGELAAFLFALDNDDAAYATFHEWRTRTSFADYGDILRDELVELIWIGNATMEPAMWYACLWCHALDRARYSGLLDTPQPMGITPIVSQPGWPKNLSEDSPLYRTLGYPGVCAAGVLILFYFWRNHHLPVINCKH